MPRTLSVAHRSALLAAATRVIAAHGLGASTAAIAKEAGVSTGTLFVHFTSKAVLVDRLYLHLKSEMGRVAADGLPAAASPREQLDHLWTRWVGWATDAPEKRRALAQLDVAEDVTDDTRAALHQEFAGTAAILEACRAGGPMHDVPLAFVLRLIDAIADATIDELLEHPGPGSPVEDPRTRTAFEAVWRAIAGSTPDRGAP